VPPTGDIEQLRQLLADKRYAEAEPQLQARLASQPGDIAAQLLHAYLQLNRKNFSSATSAANRVLADDPWNIDALLLAGLAAKWSGLPDEAIRQFKQAAYSCHHCWPAHYHLAELYRSRCEPLAALRAYRTVLQLLSATNANTDTGGLRLIPHDLPASEIRFLCEHQLRKLDPANAVAAFR
jgi:chemotaxis protein methyltransferase CheR